MSWSKRQLERQMDEEWSSVGNKFVCPDCFDDYAIKEFVVVNAVANQCSYCEQTADAPIAAEMDEVISFISEGIHREYEAPVHNVHYETAEGGYTMAVTDTWDLFYELEIHTNDKIFDDLVQAFRDYQWVQKDPYGDLPCDALRYSWEEFCDQVKHHARFVFYKLKTRDEWERQPEPFTILDSLGEIVAELGLITILPVGSEVIRARQHSSAKSYNTAAELGTAPKEKASQSRMSPAGIPMFYGAFTEGIAFAEIAVTDKSRDSVTFGKFKALRPLQLLDLSNLPSVPSMFDGDNYYKRMPLIFMRRFEIDATMPVTKDGKEHIDYVPTQIVAEYFRLVFKQPDDSRLDGILYRSGINHDGNCVALFCTNDHCTDNPDAKDKTLALVTVDRKKVESLHSIVDFAKEFDCQ
jgi:hypothetical protein